MDHTASICRRTWLVSKTLPPIRRKIIPLASRNKRVIFALQPGDDMAECKQEKQGMVSAFFYDHPVSEKFLPFSITAWPSLKGLFLGRTLKKEID